MALHAQVAGTLEMPVFFCQKASPWQRPSNENTNGLLRQYFPKGTDLRVHSADHRAAAAAELNARPRKTLGWQTPAEQLTRHASGCTAGPEMNPSTGTARTTIQDHSQPPRCDDGWNGQMGLSFSEPGHLQAQDDPGLAHTDLGDQALEPFPVDGRGRGVSLIGVDGDDLRVRPAQRDRPLPQRVLRAADSVLVS